MNKITSKITSILAIIICGIIFTACNSNQSNEEKLYPFTLTGEIEGAKDSSIVELISFYDTTYYIGGSQRYKAEIIDGKFNINGFVAEAPVSFRLESEKNKCYTEFFLISKGNQRIWTKTEAYEQIPSLYNDNPVNDEYLNYYKPVYDLYQAERWSLRVKRFDESLTPKEREKAEEIYYEYVGNKYFLNNYVSNHKDSYWALWEVIKSVSLYGYYPNMEVIYNMFSNNLKNSIAGKNLYKKIQESKLTAVGSQFPTDIVANNSVNLNEDQAIDFSNYQYTLVDFWYSNCSPCLYEFEYTKDIYKQYKDNGFNVIAVSMDMSKDKDNLDNRIAEKGYPWEQYWYKDGLQYNELNIRYFPNTFLVDKQGKIVKKGMGHEALEIFLKENLK